MCKISIVMPVYNKEKYIARGIHSILVQTFKDWELIIIDDGSTDGSLNQCKKFRDSRIQVFHTCPCHIALAYSHKYRLGGTNYILHTSLY